MKVGEQEITLAMIDEVVALLPTKYIRALSEMCYGKVSDDLVAKIKYWRAGRMQDPVESLKIFVSAQQLAKKYQEEIEQLQKK